MDNYEGICISKVAKKKLLYHLYVEFANFFKTKITKWTHNIKGDIELKKKVIFVGVDDKFKKINLKVAIEWYKNMEACL